MEHPLVPPHDAGAEQNAPLNRGLHPPARFAPGLRTQAILYGILAAAILTGLIALGSHGFHWFDATLVGYAVASVFAAAAVTYKYSFWLARPQTGRYWRRSWQLFFSYANFRRYTVLIPTAILDLFSQQYRYVCSFSYVTLLHREFAVPDEATLLSDSLTPRKRSKIPHP